MKTSAPSQLRTRAAQIRRRALGIRQTHPNPYSTHLPILAGLSRIIRVENVLELGSGPFSTSLFLDRSSFPEVARLVSFEDDAEWADEVTSAAGADPRLDLRLVKAVRGSVPEDVEGYDLIFVDDSRIFAERSETIRAVKSRHPIRPVVVIHDFEHRQYRSASRGFEHRFIFDCFTPQVGVCWNRSDLEIGQLEGLREAVEKHRSLPPTDRLAWAAALADL